MYFVIQDSAAPFEGTDKERTTTFTIRQYNTPVDDGKCILARPQDYENLIFPSAK